MTGFSVEKIKPCETATFSSASPSLSVQEVAALIRRSFATVATQFGLTPANCPTHPAYLPDATFAQQLCADAVLCYGAFDDARNCIGFVAIWPQKRSTWELTRLCTAPECRRSGVAASLLATCKAEARQRGAKKLHIGVINEHEALKQWYASRGFHETAQKVIDGLPFTVSEMICRL